MYMRRDVVYSYQMLTRDPRFPATTFGTIYSTYSSVTKKSQRERAYSQWHDARYAPLNTQPPSGSSSSSSTPPIMTRRPSTGSSSQPPAAGPPTLQRTPSFTATSPMHVYPNNPQPQPVQSPVSSTHIHVIPPSPVHQQPQHHHQIPQPYPHSSTPHHHMPPSPSMGMSMPIPMPGSGQETPRYQKLPGSDLEPPTPPTREQLLAAHAQQLLAAAAAGAPPVSSTTLAAATAAGMHHMTVPFNIPRTNSAMHVGVPHSPPARSHVPHHLPIPTHPTAQHGSSFPPSSCE